MNDTTRNPDPTTWSEKRLDHCRRALSEEQAVSLAATEQWAHVDRAKAHADWASLYARIAEIIGDAAPASDRAQALVHEHYLIASRFYVPSRLAYVGMSLFYAENDDMRDFHNQFHPRMVRYLGAAIPEYAQRTL
jgi:hypothetical protein